MKKTIAIDTWLPIFPGFYGSIFESDDELAMENVKDDNPGLKFEWDDVDWDNSGYFSEVAKACCTAMESIIEEIGLKVKIHYQSVHSPREYNFHNDVIHCRMIFEREVYDSVMEQLVKHEDVLKSYVDGKELARMFPRALEVLFEAYEDEVIDHHYLYQSITDYPTLHGEIKVEDITKINTDIVPFLTESVIEEEGDFGDFGLKLAECRRYATLVGITIGEAFKDKYPKTIMELYLATVGATQIPKPAFDRIQKLIKEKKFQEAKDEIEMLEY